MKKMIAVVLTAFLLCGLLSVGLSAADRTFSLVIDGRQVAGSAVVRDGTLYVPLRVVGRAWGGRTSWDEATQTATTVIGGVSISAKRNSFTVLANGRSYYHDGCVEYINGEMNIPMATLYRIMNCPYFAAANGVLYIDRGEQETAPATSYREEDLYWLSRIIEAESRGESMRGKIAVGSVVLNRVRSAEFPNTVYDVIFDTKFGVQFTPVANKTIYNTPCEESVQAARMCLEGESVSRDILYFCNPRLSPNSWASRNRPYAFTIGGHVFYR
ncbi:MAG: cell wall hydrolase [Ruminococcus sp.]|nr:cell wall hydrolase [Candidatus Apopatosoma intestinale]